MFQNFDTEAKQSEATQNIKAAESKKKTKKNDASKFCNKSMPRQYIVKLSPNEILPSGKKAKKRRRSRLNRKKNQKDL